MAKQIIIAEQHRVAAVFADDQIQELIVAKGTQQVSDIYVGIVENVLPSIDAAFVNIGDAEKNGFIHMGDLGPLKLRRNGGSITDLLRPQQKVLVQVMKEPTGNKGPRLTGNISLPGRYLVLMPFGRGVNLSRRIASEAERSRLRALAVFIKPAGMGLLIRTEAEGVDEEAIIEDLEQLMGQWETIQREVETTQPPALLNRDDDFIQRVLRDVYNTDVNRIVVDSHTGLKRVKQYLTSWSSGQLPQGILIDHHQDPTSILEYFRVNAAIREALKPRVDLPSGGYIIIEPTEALVVVDVNSGSFTRSATSRETVLWTNFEAATELARQLRLRNLAGVIVVDFIDMDHRSDQLRVLEHFTKAIKADKARPQIAQLSELGLVELTRKRQGQNIYELFGRACPSCNGLGHLVHLPGEVIPEEDTEGGEVMPGQRLSTVRTTPRRGRSGGRSEGRGRASRGLPSVGLESGSGGSPMPSSASSLSSNGGSPIQRHAGEDEGNGYPPDLSRRRRRRAHEPSPLEAETAADSPPEMSEAPEEDNALEIRGRGRRGRGASRTVQPVTVEMTADEQDVYAWLGISPLLLKDSDLDPQSTVVTVALPGEAAAGERLLPGAAIADNAEVDGEPSDVAEDFPSDAQAHRSKRVISRRRRPRSLADQAAEVSGSTSPELDAETTDDDIAEADSGNPPKLRTSRRGRPGRSVSPAVALPSVAEVDEVPAGPILKQTSDDADLSQPGHDGPEEEGQENGISPVRRRRRRSSARKST